MARVDVTKNCAGGFPQLTQMLNDVGFAVDHYHGVDCLEADGEPSRIIHIDTVGDNSAHIDVDDMSTQEWYSLVADEWHE